MRFPLFACSSRHQGSAQEFLAVFPLLSLPGLRTVAAALGIEPEELEGFRQSLAESSRGYFRLKVLLRSLVVADWDKHFSQGFSRRKPIGTLGLHGRNTQETNSEHTRVRTQSFSRTIREIWENHGKCLSNPPLLDISRRTAHPGVDSGWRVDS